MLLSGLCETSKTSLNRKTRTLLLLFIASGIIIKLMELRYGQRILKTKGDFINGGVGSLPRDELSASVAWSYCELEAQMSTMKPWWELFKFPIVPACKPRWPDIGH